MSKLARHVLSLQASAQTAVTGRHSMTLADHTPADRVGLYEVVHFSRTFAALIGDFSMPTPVGADPWPRGWTQWHYRIGGDVILDAAAREPIHVAESLTLLRLPHENEPQGWTYRGENQRFLTLLMHPSFVMDILRCARQSQAQPLIEMLGGTSEQFVRMQASSALTRAVKDVIQSPYQGQLRLIHLESKALEVLCISVQDLEHRLQKQPPVVLLSQRDIARLREVRAVLMQYPTRWLTITQLSRQFALNQRKLKEGFKHLFGDTVFQFAQQQRMILARRMIEEDAMSIGHVSSEIGYESHASFTAAFKRHFGYLPREARVHGRIKRGSTAAMQTGEADQRQATGANAAA